MKDKVVIITGANRGIGKEAAKKIAKLGAKVYMACRSLDSANEVKEEIIKETKNEKVFVLELDLALSDSIHKFVASFKNKESKLDVLINNAGISSRTKKLNNAGVELTFAINLLGHHYLTRLLIDLLEKSSPSRIINVASEYAGGLDLNDINYDKRSYDTTVAYKQSKQANRMLTREWAKNLQSKNISVYSMTPGWVPNTDLFREQSTFNKAVIKTVGVVGGRSVEQGADTIVWLASSDKINGNNGGFFRDRKEQECGFTNSTDEKRLWDICENYLAIKVTL
jgi:NAD(P)-dependent dehydrogenase (short-subunit alcohol dehydrogenase family)